MVPGMLLKQGDNPLAIRSPQITIRGQQTPHLDGNSSLLLIYAQHAIALAEREHGVLTETDAIRREGVPYDTDAPA